MTASRKIISRFSFQFFALLIAHVSYALTYHVEIMDMDPMQPLSPPVAVVHQGGYHLFQAGMEVTAGLEGIAEEGMTGVLVDEAESHPMVHQTVVGGDGPTFSSHKFLIEGNPGELFSFASMFGRTNDIFVGIADVPLPQPDSPMEIDAMAYDAGTEVNTGLMAHIPFYGNVGVGETESGVVAEINQYVIEDDPDMGRIEFNWPPTAKVIITPMPNAVEYMVTMTSSSEGQPLTPPLIVIHDDSAQVFAMGEKASEGLEELAVDGITSSLKNELLPVVGVWNVFVGGDGPGLEHETTVIAEPGQLVTIASMFARTNDVFTGHAGMELPAAGSTIQMETNAYDAGTEINTGLMAHIPFYGNTDGGEEEDGVIMEINSYTVVDDPEGQLNYSWPPASMIEIHGRSSTSHVSNWDLY